MTNKYQITINDLQLKIIQDAIDFLIEQTQKGVAQSDDEVKEETILIKGMLEDLDPNDPDTMNDFTA